MTSQPPSEEPNRADALPPPPPPGYSPQTSGQPQPGVQGAGSGRPLWRTVLGSVLIGLAVLVILGQLARMANGSGPADNGDVDPVAMLVANLIGIALLGVLPLVAGILLLRKPKRDVL